MDNNCLLSNNLFQIQEMKETICYIFINRNFYNIQINMNIILSYVNNQKMLCFIYTTNLLVNCILFEFGNCSI